MSASLEEKICKALKRTKTLSPLDVWEQVKNGTFQLWQHGESVAITGITEYPQRKICEGILMAGSKSDCLEIERQIEVWARAEGCHEIRTEGREGLEPMFRQAGYQKAAIVLSKELVA